MYGDRKTFRSAGSFCQGVLRQHRYRNDTEFILDTLNINSVFIFHYVPPGFNQKSYKADVIMALVWS